jgi:hypothetical protein
MWQHDANGLRFHIHVPAQYQGRHRHRYIAGYMRGWLKRKQGLKTSLTKPRPQEETPDDLLWRMFLEAYPRFKGHHYSEPDLNGEVYPHYLEWKHNLFNGVKLDDARRPGETKTAYRIRTGIH